MKWNDQSLEPARFSERSGSSARARRAAQLARVRSRPLFLTPRCLVSPGCGLGLVGLDSLLLLLRVLVLWTAGQSGAGFDRATCEFCILPPPLPTRVCTALPRKGCWPSRQLPLRANRSVFLMSNATHSWASMLSLSKAGLDKSCQPSVDDTTP